MILLIGAAIVVRAVMSAPTVGSTRSWMPSGLQGVLIHGLTVIPARRPILLAATQGGIERKVAGRRWRRVLSSVEVWAIATNNGSHVSMAGDENGDIEISRDQGRSWRRTKVASQAIYAIAPDPRNSRVWLAGAGEGLYRSANSGRTWRRVLTLPGAAIAAFAWPSDGSNMLLAGAVAGRSGASTKVYVSRDSGRTWVIFGHGLNSGAGIMSLAVLKGNRLIAGTMGHAAWTATGFSGIWHSTATGMPPRNDHVAALVASHTASHVLFAGTLGYGVFRSADSGQRWVSVLTGLSTINNSSIVLALLYAPASGTLYAGTANGIYTAREAVSAPPE